MVSASATAGPLDTAPGPIGLDRRAPSRGGNSPRPEPVQRGAGALPSATNQPDETPGDLDRELVRRVQRGERAAFDLLVARYQHRIGGLLQNYLRDPAEREDVAQEVFLKAWRGLAHFRGESGFYTWLYRIAINTARNHLAAADRRPGTHGLDPADVERYDDGALLRDTATPERNCVTGEIRQAIEGALAAMPACIREAVTLREMKGLSYDEIAAAMDCPVGTVRSRIARGRAAIEEWIRPVLHGEDAAGADAATAPE